MRAPLSRRFCLLAGIALAPATALAGAWTQPQGEGQMIASLYGWGGSRRARRRPAASESRIAAQTLLEYGLYDRLTLFGEISAEHYALGAPTPDVYNGLDYSASDCARACGRTPPRSFRWRPAATCPARAIR